MTAKVGTKIRKIGNGYGVLLPKSILDDLRLSEGDVLVVERGSDGILLAPSAAEFEQQMAAYRQVEPRHRNTLRELAK